MQNSGREKMGKKYLETKNKSLESSILGVWKTAVEEGAGRMDGRTSEYRNHRKKLESARQRRESKRVTKEDVELDKILEMSDEEFEKLVDNFDNFLRAWEKEYLKENKDKKPKNKEGKDWKPRIEDVSQHCSLEEIRDMLLDDPELTDHERFDLYYEEHERANKKKVKTYTLDEMLKGTKIGRYKPPNNEKK